MDIIFTDTLGVDEKYQPVPSSKIIPRWFKDSEGYIPKEYIYVDGQNARTIKKCLPVLDAITAGYQIKTFVDVRVTQKNGTPYYEWPGFNPISFHPIEQAKEHPYNRGAPYPKWNNPWSIKTPSGYSCLFISPMHTDNNIFTILPGIVDTDTFTAPVNFPFVLNNINWSGLIPAGTPIAQVIPFKRDVFKMYIGGNKELIDQSKSLIRLKSLWFNSYKKQFWNKKEYK